MMEDVDDDVDEVSDAYFSKSVTRVFDKIDNVNDCVLTS